MNSKFMKIATNAARRGRTPFGAVIIKDDKIITKAYNTVEKNKNAVYHAETNVIMKACRKLKTWDLSDCEIYTTCMPCAMCAGAIHWSRIKSIYFGCSIKDAKEFGFNEIDLEATKIILKNCHIEGGILREECYRLFVNYKGNKY